ncbi:hypothetical protein CH63R_01614 [Colletotrichum higginsianum IMI 349063]|uniref:Uncharacterized protein n=1 Tax=Colletotrichum higginsianum (strain IMI 349063) TaxID=759273 RepID=A0A1B7YWU1_COLHI|nr:hypothetical protein CH63R_01614 [Colletotrichum higginsianum IMI 349063]OBR16434.1 hypothetical protein CH63R_01614 [Colletotrichum higginsianum IMI 349063]
MNAPAGDIPRAQPPSASAPAQHTGICFSEQLLYSGPGTSPDQPRSRQRWGLDSSEAVSFPLKILAKTGRVLSLQSIDEDDDIVVLREVPAQARKPSETE